MHTQFSIAKDESSIKSDLVLTSKPCDYTWNPQTNYHWCCLHKLSCNIKSGLEELGQYKPLQDQQQESVLGVFPISGKLPVIAEDDEDKNTDTLVSNTIDLEGEGPDVVLDEDCKTNHDSEDVDVMSAAPDSDEDVEDQLNTEDPLNTTSNLTLEGFKNGNLRKHSNQLNQLISKFVNELLAEDLELLKNKNKKGKPCHLQNPCGKSQVMPHCMFILITDLSELSQPFLDLTKRMEGDGPTGSTVISEFYALKVHLANQASKLQLGDTILPMIISVQAQVNLLENKFNQTRTELKSSAAAKNTKPPAPPKNSAESEVNSLCHIFIAPDTELQQNKVAAYLKGSHSMAPMDNAREIKAILPWWKVSKSETCFFLTDLHYTDCVSM
ncbi:hypothetical protein DFH28DRAFT_901500 [Melampsora americana]|nr:hypothetical protein DFH28DRAFT_901500 [Melampsora americana]